MFKQHLVTILSIFIVQASCTTHSIKTTEEHKIIRLLADTIGNPKAQWDYNSHLHYNSIAKQINLGIMDNGTDSIEIRLWANYGLSPTDQLIILKGIDTFWTYSYYEVTVNNEQGSYAESIVDSSLSKSVHLLEPYRDEFINSLKIDSIWNLPSQSQINIPKELGWTDGTIYCLELSDRKRFKFISYINPNQYYTHLRDNSHLTFLNFINLLYKPIEKYNLQTYAQ